MRKTSLPSCATSNNSAVAFRISGVTTGSGDDGRTGIAGSARLPKDDPRIEALGAVDELNSHLGLLRAMANDPPIEQLLESLQHEAFDLGAMIAGSERPLIGVKNIARLEAHLRNFNAALPPLEEFVLPGGSAVAAQCHVARTVCRRAERRVVAVGSLPKPVRVYLNRLSDLLFVLARTLAQTNGVPETLWQASGRDEAP